MSKKAIEMMVGLFMILGLVAIVFLALKVSGLSAQTAQQSYYRVTAEFDNVGGLKVRAPVMVAGVWVGKVGNIELSPVTYRAKVTLWLAKNGYRFPTDTTASIYTQGLLGANYVNLTPGYTDVFLKNGGVIENTQPAIVLEKLISQFLYSIGNSGDKK